MSEHDQVRIDAARKCEEAHSVLTFLTLPGLRKLEEETADAIRGLQSTDDPSGNALHDSLQQKWGAIKERIKRFEPCAHVRALLDDVQTSNVALQSHGSIQASCYACNRSWEVGQVLE